MKTEITIKINSEWEAARLLVLVEDGMHILNKQGRTQRGLDGYTYAELRQWFDTLNSITPTKCKYVSHEI